MGSGYAQVSLPEDAGLDFKGLAVKYGQQVEEFDVDTKDGYILKLFHIIGDRRRPVLMVHGMMDSSDGFIVRGNLSLAVNLAKEGYDLWVINHRGNRYSRRHVSLNPDNDRAFWNFYVHEYGSKDLPPTIDFITEKTGSKVSIIGYSEGTTTSLVLGATRPEYNEKVNVFIALAPICFLNHTRSHVSTVIRLGPQLNRGLRMLRTEEIVGYHSPIKAMIHALCNIEGISYAICVQGVVFPLTGVDPEQFEPDFLPIWLGHFPAGSSRKNLYHLAQLGIRKTFARYDYGAVKNMVKYGSREPPEYDLSKVTMKVAMLVSKNDPVATIDDAELLRRRLPNAVEYRVLEYPRFNHIDFVWGRTTYTVVLPQVLNILNKYG